MTCHIEAFKVIPVAEAVQPAINCIHAYGDKLLLGLSSGALQVFSIKDPFSPQLSSQLYATYNGLAERPIDQIGVIKDVSSLVILADNVIRIHDLESFEQEEVLGLTKGATVFAIVDGVREFDNGYASMVSRLVVGAKRTLISLEWRDSEFVQHKQIALPDRVRTISFIHPDRVLLGLASAEYCIVDLVSSQIIDTALRGAHASSSSTFSSISYIGIGSRSKPPLSTRIGQDNAVIVHDSVGHIIDYMGQYSESQTITWDATVEGLGYSYPYFICVLPAKCIEVRNPDTMNIVQTLPLTKIKHISDGKLLYVATTDKVYRMLLNDHASQIQSLVDQNHLAEAISLLNQIESVLMPGKEEMLRKLQILSATEKFKGKKFEESLNLFSDISAPPDVVLALYPKNLWVFPDSTLTENIEDSSALSEERAQSPSSEHGPVNSTDSVPQLRESEIIEAVRALQQYLADSRRKISKLRTSQEPIMYHNYELSKDIYGDLERAASLVDTTLLNCYLLISPALVGPLVRVHNHCDPVVVQKTLSDAGKWKELIDFYYAKSMHRDALDLLAKLGKSQDEPGLEGPDLTVKYIQKLDNNNIDLIFQYIEWPLSCDIEYGEHVFMDDSPESLSLARPKVFKFLQRVSSDHGHKLLEHYLEYVINELGETSPTFHDHLLSLYIKDVSRDETRSFDKLLSFINSSTQYRPDRVIRDVPKNDPRFHEPLALLYGHRGDDPKALELYAYNLKDHKKARQYCSDLYDQDTKRGSKALGTLLTLYLSQNAKEYRSDVIDLLSSQGSRMSAIEVLESLPADTNVKDINFFLQSQIRNLHSSLNNEQITSSFLQVHLIRTQEQFLELSQSHSLITYLRTCKVCTRRLGHSVISVFPDGEVVHFGCSNAYRDTLKAIKERSKLITVKAEK